MLIRLAAFAVAGLALPQSLASAAEIYVDMSIAAACEDYRYEAGAGRCGGGDSAAAATLADGLATLVPGDTLILTAGTYGQIRPLVSGMPGRPITIRGVDPDTVQVTSARDVGLWIQGVTDIRIADIAVTDVEGFGRVEESTRITIENVRFHAARASGTTGALKFVRSRHNRVLDSHFDQGSDLLLLQDDSDRNVVTGNVFGRAHHSELSIRCASFNVIRGNTFDNPDQKAVEILDCEGVSDAPVRLDDSQANLLEFNRFMGTAPAGQNHYFNAIQHGGQHTIVRYNIFSGNAGGGVNFQYYGDESLYVYGNRLYNNTFYDNRCFAVVGQRGAGKRFRDNRAVNNLLYGNSDCRGRGRKQVDIADDWQVILDHNSMVTSDPGFVDAAGGDLRLQGTSTQVDAGVHITRTVDSGAGTRMAVEDASWFHDGYGIAGETPDTIRIEASAGPVAIEAIDRSANVLILSEPARWERGAGVHPDYAGAAPDVGAFEFRPD